MDSENNIKEKIISFISTNDLYMFPLHSIYNGQCTCGNTSCASPGKHPLLKYNWKYSCTNKTENIKKWFAKTNVNYAIATGKLSEKTGKRLIVIDIDNPQHEFLKNLPKNFRYQTGSGGWHYWFWTKYSISNSVSYLADKVDVRGANGYVIIPPSIHRTGNKYNRARYIRTTNRNFKSFTKEKGIAQGRKKIQKNKKICYNRRFEILDRSLNKRN